MISFSLALSGKIKQFENKLISVYLILFIQLLILVQSKEISVDLGLVLLCAGGHSSQLCQYLLHQSQFFIIHPPPRYFLQVYSTSASYLEDPRRGSFYWLARTTFLNKLTHVMTKKGVNYLRSTCRKYVGARDCNP